ncbi:MAG: hypothetical protein ACREAB_18715 [Blastocatellia bacterium]
MIEVPRNPAAESRLGRVRQNGFHSVQTEHRELQAEFELWRFLLRLCLRRAEQRQQPNRNNSGHQFSQPRLSQHSGPGLSGSYY